MDTSKRIVVTAHGSTDVLKLVESPVFAPIAGEVGVRVLAAGVGYSDVMAQHGGYPLAPGIPFTPGYDFVGIVDRLGEGVSGLHVGQMVAALNPAFGCYAEYICLPAKLLVPVPAGLAPAQVAGLILNYLTAHCILHRKGKLQTGEIVLIHGAAGGVGTALLELGGQLQLRMYGTASHAKHATVEKLGGIPIDYRKEDFQACIRKEFPDGIDAAFDPVGGANLRRSYRVVRKGGRVISYGFAGSRFGGLGIMIAGVMQMGYLNLLPDGKRVRLCATPGEVKKDNDWYRATLAELLALLANGNINPLVGARIPLADAAQAHQLLEQGKVNGKVVLMME